MASRLTLDIFTGDFGIWFKPFIGEGEREEGICVSLLSASISSGEARPRLLGLLSDACGMPGRTFTSGRGSSGRDVSQGSKLSGRPKDSEGDEIVFVRRSPFLAFDAASQSAPTRVRIKVQLTLFTIYIGNTALLSGFIV